jgi:hypothetical protein
MPWFLTHGSVGFDDEVDSSSLPSHLARCLRDVDANAIEIDGNTVRFKGGIFRLVTNWNVLVPFGFGDLTINSEPREVCYRLSYQQSVVCLAIGLGIVVTPMLAFGTRGIPGGVIGFCALSLSIAFVNFLVGISRFDGFISRSVGGAPRVRRSPAQPITGA